MPLFYWFVHWVVIHFVAIGIFMSQGFHWSDLQFSGFGFGHPKNGGGLDLAGVYAAWLGVVIFMYPLSKYYGQYKANHKENIWLRYL